MPVDVKICGLRRKTDLAVALEGGAAYVGLVFYPPSPRNIATNEARRLAEQARGRAQIVALMVDPDDDLVSCVADDVRPDWIQLHGDESPERVRAIKAGAGGRIIKVIKVASGDDVRAGAAYDGAADMLLFDAKGGSGSQPAEFTLPGGNGLAFDWRLLKASTSRLPWMLSGGLDPDNVAAAIAATGATAIDVSSGVERSRGVKDPARIRAFLHAANTATHSHPVKGAV